MHQILGGPDINWATMAMWASRRAGTTIRHEDAPDLTKAAGLLGPFAGGALDHVKGVVAEPVAAGNREVYGEIALAYVNFITAFDGLEQRDPERLRWFLTTLDPAPLEWGGQELLIQAFTNYYRAKFEKDPDRKSELMLLANAQIGLHEQTRLQGHIEAAMPPFAERLITEHIMTLPLPLEELHLGEDLPVRGRMYPQHLETIELPEAREFLARYDRTPDTTKGSGADDWTRLSDRMNYIYDLFRSRQTDASLWSPPLSLQQQQALHSTVGRILAQSSTQDG